MKRRQTFLLVALIMLSACTTVEAPQTQSEQTQTLPTPSLTTNSIESSIAPVSSEQAQGTALPNEWQQTVWEDVVIPVPPDYVWQIGAPPPNPGYNAPVLASGRIAFNPATKPEGEVPDGMGFTIVQWSKSLDEWVAMVQKAAAAQNPVDTNSITRSTVAERPAVAYSYSVTGISNSQTSVVQVGSDRVLVIENSNLDNPEYQRVLRMLTIKQP